MTKKPVKRPVKPEKMPRLPLPVLVVKRRPYA